MTLMRKVGSDDFRFDEEADMPVSPIEMADRTFYHLARNGIVVRAERCDLRGGVVVEAEKDSTEQQVVQAVAQAFAWHACMIHSELRSFAGYDCVSIEIQRV